jgi:FliI/YscN family ATPase
VATSIAEWFRDRGQHVVFLLDSITRVAFAQRELGLSASEPPTTKAFPPSVFSLLPQLLERTGPGEFGTITGFYTVLVEADDLHDPIGDAVRGILDGHVWLARRLANRGHFPAIDVLESVSRVMKDVVTPEHSAAARRLVEDLARYRDVEDLIQLGAYVRGVDAKTDEAVDRMPAIEELLRQTSEESSSFDDAVQGLCDLYQGETVGRLQ